MLENYLQQYFGFTTFKKGQKEVIQRILNHESAAAIFPTGAGKSLCYQLPAMLLPGMTLVVSPLLSLMKDQMDFLTGHNIPAARLDSTLPQQDYNRVLEQGKCGELKILMIAVERLKNERFRHQLHQMKVSLMVIDEAHCISEWGHNFRPEYLKLPDYQKDFHIPQVLLLTATATEQVREDMCRKLNIDQKNITVTGFYRPNLFLQVTPTQEIFKNKKLLERLRADTNASTIVYVTLQKTAATVAQSLIDSHIRAACYHAGMSSEEREHIQNLFMEGKLDCVVATIAFGMGLDKSDLRRVIHYDLPKSIENYSQEIGRSGRDGLASFCEVLANRDNITILENFIYGDTPVRGSIYKVLEKILSNDSQTWPVKLNALSDEVNIRPLPLKTLLVYLDMEGIIKPKYTYFEDYSFTYCETAEQIIDRFQGEQQQFVRVLLSHCKTYRTWTRLDMTAVLKNYQTERSRVVAALEYFAEKKWIELQAKQSIDIYDIVTKDFDINELADKLFQTFSSKETHEIQRIHSMLSFFESDSCINRKLATYFGEQLTLSNCGHCSACRQGKAMIEHTVDLPRLASIDFQTIANKLPSLGANESTVVNLTKYLCGIYTPCFKGMNIKMMPHFGLLERYPYQDVYQWIAEHARLGHLQMGNPGADPTSLISVRKERKRSTKSKGDCQKISHKQARYFTIGQRFNDGCTVEQLAVDFNILVEEVFEDLYQCYKAGFHLNDHDFLINSKLTHNQQDAVILSFACLGIEKVNSVFKDLTGEIAYEELHRVRLSCLNRERHSPIADTAKTFVCLAVSRKYGGYCLAGKEWADGKVGPWLRPVSRQENGELATGEIRMNNGEIPQYMDIITIETEGAAGHRYQKENILIAGKTPWIWQWKLPCVALPSLVDDVNRLWQTGFHSANGLNDRVPEESVITTKEPSIYLIRPDGFTLIVSADLDERKKVRASFTYRDASYLLSVTDPLIERTYLMKNHGEYPLTDKDLYLTVSLGEPFNGYCYKLIAAVITMEG